MKRIALVYFNAGGGHRASATALEAVIREQRRPWQVSRVNLIEVLDPQDSFRKLMGFAPEDIYNKRLARGWTIGLAQELKLLQGMIRMGHPTLVRTLQQHWLKTEPDLVVSLIPNFNRALHESLATSLPGVPYVTVLTDLADHPPNFWIEAERPQHFICGTPKAVAQARATAHPASTVHTSSGMILRPDFYRPHTIDRAEARRRVGLDPDRPTGLVMFGGQGSKAMLSIAKQLADTPLIFVCGHNAALADKLRALPTQAPHHVIGYTADIPAVMHLADFFIGKPGPGSLSEAVQQHLPVIVVRNAWTMPQERYNTHWVRDNGLGLVLKSFSGIDVAVQELTRRLDEFKANTRRIDNRAVFEIPDMLAHILVGAEQPIGGAALAAIKRS